MTVLCRILAIAAVLLFVGLCVAVCGFYRYAMVRRPEPETEWWTLDPEKLPNPARTHVPEAFRDMLYREKLWSLSAYRMRGRRYEMRSADGLRLIAHYVPPEGEQRGIYLMVHGYRSCGFSDFCGAVRPMTEDGFGCFVIDQRAHGESEGDTICFGVLERYDVRDWAALIDREFPGVPVILDGVSMGAASVMAAATLDLPGNVRAIVADCGYTSMREIFEKVIRQWFHLPPFPLVPLVSMLCRWKNGFGFDDVHSEACLAGARVPVLLAHGEADDFVPHAMAEQIVRAVQDTVDIEFVSVKDAGHGLSYLVDRTQYQAALDRLYAKIEKNAREVGT